MGKIQMERNILMNTQDTHLQAVRLLTVKGASKYLAISDRTLYSLANAGRIKAVRIGARCVRYDITDLDKFIQDAKGA